jgi:hypothetical protein
VASHKLRWRHFGCGSKPVRLSASTSRPQFPREPTAIAQMKQEDITWLQELLTRDFKLKFN